CRLRILDMTDLGDAATAATTATHGPAGMSLWSSTVALAKACLEISKHQSHCLKRSSKRRKVPSGASPA
ncbi:LRC14 protein, partial [Zapornia atra]|nr:LRC14 protein [Zapornia atra]